MKKIRNSLVHTLLLAALLLSLLPTAAYAASGSLKSNKSTLRAGDTFTLSYAASGTDLQGLDLRLTYDSSNLTYSGYKFNLGSSWAQPSGDGSHIVTYDTTGTGFSSKTVVTYTFKVKSGVAPGTKLTASISCTISDSKGASSSAGASWSATVAQPLSGDAALKDLWCDNAELDFTGGTEYSLTVPFEVSSLDLDWSRSHSGSKVSVSGNSLSVGSNTVTVTVTAENGNTKRYYIYVTRQQDPNYVPSTDAALSGMTPSVGTLSPVFHTDVTDYVLYVPYETTALTISGSARDSKALGVSTLREVLVLPEESPAEGEEAPADKDASGEPAPEPEPEYRTLADDEPLPEGETVYTVTCTAEDGVTTKSYTVHVIRMPAYEGMLPEIIPPVTETEPEPEPEPTTFDISLPLVLNLPYVGEVTLQQAALGALIALGVLLLLLLLIVWLLGRRRGRKKALRQMAKAAAAQEPAPLLDRLAAQDAAAAAAAEASPEEAPAEAPAAEESVAAAAVVAAEAASGTEEAPAEEPAPEAEEVPAEEPVPEVAESPVEEPAAEESPVEEPAPAAEETPTEEPAPGAKEVPSEEPTADPDDPATMSLDDLLEDIRKM